MVPAPWRTVAGRAGGGTCRVVNLLPSLCASAGRASEVGRSRAGFSLRDPDGRIALFPEACTSV